MNEEIKAKLTEYLGVLESAAKSGGDFMSAQLPLFIQELLAWEFYSSIFLVVTFAILALLGAYFCRKCIKWLDTHNDKCNRECAVGPCIVGAIITAVFTVVMISCSATNGYHAVKAGVAPRVIILEKVVELGRSISK